MWSPEQCWEVLLAEKGQQMGPLQKPSQWSAVRSRWSSGLCCHANRHVTCQQIVWNQRAEAYIFSLDQVNVGLKRFGWWLVMFFNLNIWHCEKELPMLCFCPLIGLLIDEFAEKQTVLSQELLFPCCWLIKILKAWPDWKILARLGWEKIWPFRGKHRFKSAENRFTSMGEKFPLPFYSPSGIMIWFV